MASEPSSDFTSPAAVVPKRPVVPAFLPICQVSSLAPTTVKVAGSASLISTAPAATGNMSARPASVLRAVGSTAGAAFRTETPWTPPTGTRLETGTTGITSPLIPAQLPPTSSPGALAWTAVSPKRAARVLSSSPWVRAKATRLPVSGTGVAGVINSICGLSAKACRPTPAKPSAARSCRPGSASRLPRRLAKSAPRRAAAGVGPAATDRPVEGDGALRVREERFASMWFSRRSLGYQAIRKSGTCPF